MSNYRSFKFSDLASITRGGSPRPIKEFMVDKGIPWVKISDATQSNSRYIYKTKEFIKEEGKNKSREVYPGDLILSNSATPGIPRFMKTYACIHDGWLLIKDFKELDQNYCFYMLLNERPRLLALGNGSVFTNLKTEILKSYIFKIPALKKQKSISNILSSLDEKIELNQKINATLEAMAQALFKSWFVDFDPVKAKLAAVRCGRDPEKAAMAAIACKLIVTPGKPKPDNLEEKLPSAEAIDAAIASLETLSEEQMRSLKEKAAHFPSDFIESELGFIPEGWSDGFISDIIFKINERVGNLDAIVLSPVSYGELVRSEDYFTKQVYSKSIKKYRLVKKWDFAYNPSRINIGSLGLLKENIIGAVSPVYEVFRAKEGFHYFIEMFLKQPSSKKWILSLSSGSVRQSLKFSELSLVPLVVPPSALISKYNEIWDSMFSYLEFNNIENKIIGDFRDALLPKLLSGEISVASD